MSVVATRIIRSTASTSADKRDHAAVVVGVLLDVEQCHPWSVLYLGHDAGDLRLVPAL
jgi:hypothetical protein